MLSSQSNFNLRLPISYLVRSYLIPTVKGKGREIREKETQNFMDTLLRQSNSAMTKNPMPTTSSQNVKHELRK